MFERFDDPDGFVPDDGFRAAVGRRGAQLRRRRRVGRTAMAAVTAVALAAGGIGLYVARRDAAIDRVDVATQPSVDGALNILLIGSDQRPPDDPDGVSGVRADTIVVLRIDDTGSHLLSIPRDLLDADGQRINGAFAGGPQAMVDDVVRSLGIPIDHVVVLDFAGFIALVDAVGGLDVSVAESVRDQPTGLALEPTACTTLDGETALGLVRARHLERYDAATGTWVVDPAGDLGRIARQQAVLGLALDQLDTYVATVDRLSRLLADHAVVDDGLTLERLIAIGRRLADGPPLQTATLPVQAGTTDDGAAVLVIDSLNAVPTLARFGAAMSVPDGVPTSNPVTPTVGVVPIGPCT